MPLPIKRASVFADGLDHPECVAVHPTGTVWAGGEAGQIYRISPDGKTVTEVGNTGGFVLGIAFAPTLDWLAICDLRLKCVMRFDIFSRTLTEFTRGGDTPFLTPNHLCFTRNGDLFVTDSGSFRKVNGNIRKFDSNGQGGIWHRGPFNFSNGIALGPRGDAVYVCCTWLPGVERIEIKPDGSAGKRTIYAKLPKSTPDGLAFDARGNLYVSCYYPARIYKIDTKGKVSVYLDDWDAHTISNPTNIAFGGPKFDQIFAANLGRWHITRIDAHVKGLPLASHGSKK